MTPRDLKIWRLDRKLTLVRMARGLGVSRNTAWNYENGATPLPVDLAERLNAMTFDLAGKLAEGPPDRLTRMTAALRPDLKLYTAHGLGPEHPALLGLPRPVPTPAAPHSAYPYAVLDSAEYQEALARHHGDDLARMERMRANEVVNEGRAAQSRIDHGMEQPGDVERVAAMETASPPPPGWPYDSRTWFLLPEAAKHKWLRENGR